MLPRGPSGMLAQLKLPTYTAHNRPPEFMSWVRQVANLNLKKRVSMTEQSLKSSWIQTMSDLGLAERIAECTNQAGQKAINEIVQKNNRFRAWTATAQRSKMHPEAIVYLDVTSYKLPWLGTKHVEAIRYHNFVKQLRQANPDKHTSRQIVEACFWQALNIQIRNVKAKGTIATAMIEEGRKVLARGRKYWDDIANDELSSDE